MPRRLSIEERSAHAARLERDGFAVVPNILSPDEIDAVMAELRPLQEAVSLSDNEFEGLKTRRVYNLMAKTRALDPLLVHPDVTFLLRSVLGPSIQLSISSTVEIFPGEAAQVLHQDDAFFQMPRPHPAVVCNTMWALTEFTERNGATRLVPGSHLSAAAVDPAASTIPAEMPVGSVLIWTGALWHGGGANRAEKERLGVSLNYTRGYMRQQENQYLAISPNVAATLDDEVLKMLGYDNSEFIGFIDREHPLSMLRRKGISLNEFFARAMEAYRQGLRR